MMEVLIVEVLDFAAIIVSVVALVLSLFQFFVERKRVSNQATIDSFAELQSSVFNMTDFNELDVDKILLEYKKEEPTKEVLRDWENLSEYMARIEQFAVGVNTGVFNIKIVDRMAGSHIIKQYNRLYPVICYKREKGKTNKRYEEFEKMAKKLSKYNTDIVIILK